MLTYQDCVALSQLSEEEITAIARHEHMPDIAALELVWASYQTSEGKRRIQHVICERESWKRCHAPRRVV